MIDTLWVIVVVLGAASGILGLLADNCAGYRAIEDRLLSWALVCIVAMFIAGGTAIYLSIEQQEETKNERVTSQQTPNCTIPIGIEISVGEVRSIN